VARGYERLTTNHVAEAAGVSVGSLYEYFPDREALVAEVARVTVAAILEDAEAALGRALADELEPGLRRWIRAVVRAASARRALVRVLWREVPFVRSLREVEAIGEAVAAFAARFREEHEHGAATPPHRPEATTFLVTVMGVYGLLEGVLARPRGLGEAEVQAAFEELVVGLVVGELQRATSSRSGTPGSSPPDAARKKSAPRATAPATPAQSQGDV
jgi:AcrR family transcriptional regulator